MNEGDIIDTLVSLHIILEIGLNALFRQIALILAHGNIDSDDIVSNIDEVSFKDKVAMFIYNSDFDFSGKEKEAQGYHKIIGSVKGFSQIRNLLLHGHSIATVFDGTTNKDSKLKQKLSLETLEQQLRIFRFILEGMGFYLDCFKSSLSQEQKDTFKQAYLDTSFLPHLIVPKE